MSQPESTQGARPCANCGERPGTVRWGGALAATHGWVVLWCEVCALEAQVEHARERADALPALEARLREAKARV